jgi:hypothetical protein
MGLYIVKDFILAIISTLLQGKTVENKKLQTRPVGILYWHVVRFHSLLKAMLNIVVGNAIREFGKVLLQCSHNKKKC